MRLMTRLKSSRNVKNYSRKGLRLLSRRKYIFHENFHTQPGEVFWSFFACLRENIQMWTKKKKENFYRMVSSGLWRKKTLFRFLDFMTGTFFSGKRHSFTGSASEIKYFICSRHDRAILSRCHSGFGSAIFRLLRLPMWKAKRIIGKRQSENARVPSLVSKIHFPARRNFRLCRFLAVMRESFVPSFRPRTDKDKCLENPTWFGIVMGRGEREIKGIFCSD